MVRADSAKIMRLMRTKHIGLYALAHCAGTSHGTIRKAIEGLKPISIMSIFKIAEALGVDHNDLIQRKAGNVS